MHTIQRTALSGLLLTLVGCTSAPTTETSKLPARASEQAPAAVDSASLPESAPEPASAPTPEPMAESLPAPVPVAVAAAVEVAKQVAKPAAKPVPASKPTVVAKPVVVETAPVANAESIGSISGSLKLIAGPGQSVSAGEVNEGLVYFLPNAGSPKPKPGRFIINTRSKGFIPETLVVPQGSTVRFPNIDTIIHNVYSRSPGNSFDLGYYGPGAMDTHKVPFRSQNKLLAILAPMHREAVTK